MASGFTSVPLPSTSSGSRFQCHICFREVDTARGLKSHITRKHPETQTDGRTSSTTAPLQGTPISAQPGDLGLELGRLRSSIKILRRIPKGARGPAAEALRTLLTACISEGSVRTWRRLLLFSAACLQVPVKSSDISSNLTAAVKRNISDYMSGGPEPKPSPSRRRTRTRATDSARAHLVQSKLSDGDVRGAVRVLGSSDTFAPDDAHTLSTLQDLHPPPDHSLTHPSPPLNTHTPLTVSESAVLGAITSFPAGSSGGPDLLKPQHLKDLTSHSAGPAGAALLTALTSFCNFLLSGDIPEEIRPVFFGATLCAFSKPSGGVRPIAIGCTIRRLVAKLCSYHLASKYGNGFYPTQFGFGVRRGIEIATHLTRRYVTFPHSRPKFFLKVDFKNAFNTLSRAHVISTISTTAPEISHFVRQCYHQPSSLIFADNIITSSNGVQQGDPLGPALFCSVLQPVTEAMTAELNVWYLDDGSFGGELDILHQDFITLSRMAAERGLQINPAKCELFGLGASPEEIREAQDLFFTTAPNLQFPPLESCTQLGTPLFSQALAESLADKTAFLLRITSRLQDLQAHNAYFILKHSLAIPKLSHILRCGPSWDCKQELQTFDTSLREALCKITNVSLSDGAWEQASWPVKSGGLGIRHAVDISLPAFLSSVYGTLQQVDSLLPAEMTASIDPLLQRCLDAWKTKTSAEPPTSSLSHLQREWERPMIELSYRNSLNTATTPLSKARLLGVSSAESGAFLQAYPSEPIGTLLDDDTFRIAIALRLGAPICTPHQCKCGSPVEDNGLHGLSCRRSAGRIPRHVSVNTIIQRALTSAGVPSSLEPPSLAPDSSIRPDGVTMVPWKEGKTLAWDFTCTDGQAPSHVPFSHTEPLYAASLAERNKHTKYAELTRSHLFVPIAVECLGSIGKEGLNFLREIGRKTTSLTGEKRAFSYLLQRISGAIQRGNAQSVLGTIPGGDSLDALLERD